jgi:hypothetical protein
MEASDLSMETSGMSGTTAVHVARARMTPALRMGCPSSMTTAGTAASIAFDCRG